MTLGALAAADEVLLVVGGDPIGIRRGIVAHRTLAEARPGRGREGRASSSNRAPRSARRVQDCSSQLSEWTGQPADRRSCRPSRSSSGWSGKGDRCTRSRRGLRGSASCAGSSVAGADGG